VTPAEEGARSVLRILAATARGPKREGAFAVWLTLRVAGDLADAEASSERLHRRRVQALERRLSSLTLPPPLRRALVGTLSHLRDATPESAAVALAQLVAPVRDTLGPEAGDAVRRVAASVRST
jgi:hypothetical protein